MCLYILHVIVLPVSSKQSYNTPHPDMAFILKRKTKCHLVRCNWNEGTWINRTLLLHGKCHVCVSIQDTSFVPSVSRLGRFLKSSFYKVCASDIRGEPMDKGDAHSVPLSTTNKFLSCFLVSVYGTISLLRKSQTHCVISTYHLHNTLTIYVLSIKKQKTIR